MGQAAGVWWRASALLVLLSAGCETTNPFLWNWQTHNAKPDEYTVPPVTDARYSEPQRFPKYLTTPSLKKPDSDSTKPPAGFGGPPSAGGSMYQ
jgi:hypothetical protein